MPLTDKQRHALAMAYSDGYILDPDPWGDGPHPRTVSSLVKRGFIVDAGEEHVITDAGKEALGVRWASAPSTLEEALAEAMERVLPDSMIDDFVRGDERTFAGLIEPAPGGRRIFYGDEPADFSGALCMIDGLSVDSEEDHVLIDVVCTMVREAGFAVDFEIAPARMIGVWSIED